MITEAATTTQSRADRITGWYKKAFPVAASWIRKSGGTIEEAKELFQEALIIFYEKIDTDKFDPKVNDNAYLLGIVKKLWAKYVEDNSKLQTLSSSGWQDETEPKPLEEKLLRLLRQSGQKCMDLLQSFYYENLSMREISERFGYRSERSATVQKYKCLEKVRHEVKLKSLEHESFLS